MTPPDPIYTARLLPHGQRFDAPAGQPLLLAAEAAGLPMDSSCRNGTCRTCMCLLVQGQVSYRIEWPGLSAEEKAEGFILPCVAYPASDVVLQPAALPDAPGPTPDSPPDAQAPGWLVAVGTAVLMRIDPALVEFGELAGTVACASSQDMARDSVRRLRAQAADLCGRIPPMAARAVSRVVRHAERASGSVLDKRARLHELEQSWGDLLICLRSNPRG